MPGIKCVSCAINSVIRIETGNPSRRNITLVPYVGRPAGEGQFKSILLPEKKAAQLIQCGMVRELPKIKVEKKEVVKETVEEKDEDGKPVKKQVEKTKTTVVEEYPADAEPCFDVVAADAAAEAAVAAHYARLRK